MDLLCGWWKFRIASLKLGNGWIISSHALCLGMWFFNSSGPSDAIWRWRSWSTLVQVMACCLTAPSHYLNQCWLIISKVLRHSSEDIIIRRFEDTNQYNKIEHYIFKITLRSPRGQWVKLIHASKKGPRSHSAEYLLYLLFAPLLYMFNSFLSFSQKLLHSRILCFEFGYP